MRFQYSPLLGNASQDRELEATFTAEGSDVEESDEQSESRPLKPIPSGSPPSQPGAYDFENLDYDYPPPGSPPRPSATAIPNNPLGNSNGQIPTSTPQYPEPRRIGFLRRAVQSIFPNHQPEQHLYRPVGGGIENDGVFANMNAKPTPGRIIQDSDSGIHVVPEEVQQEAPPSYVSAQADAVPPYWETTIHAPAGFGGPGEIMVDGLPTGSLFSFIWNFLVSMSFQFLDLVSHSFITVFLRTRTDALFTWLFSKDSNDGWTSTTGDRFTDTSIPTASPGNTNDSAGEATSFPLAEGTSEWLSFLLMTAGWFILLTSIIAFWRVKRWERSIMTSTPTEASDTNQNQFRNPFIILRQSISFPGATWRRRNEPPREDEEAILQSSEMPLPNVSIVTQPGGNSHDLDQAMEMRAFAEIARIQQERLEQTFRDAGLVV